MQLKRVRSFAVIGLLSFGSIVSAQVRYVDDTATGANTGLTWCDAFVRLQDALAVQNFTNLEIRVAQGVYRPDRTAAAPGGSGSRLETFALRSGRNVRGGYAGCGAPDPNARNVALYQTILSGDLAGNDGSNFANNGDNSYHIVSYTDGNAVNVVLDGFTVSAGKADGIGPAGTITNQGAAVHIRNDDFKCINGGPTLRNCTFRDNWAMHHGAVNDHGNSTVVENCTFRDNYSGVEGAGLLIHSGSATVVGTSFIDNHCDGQGGAVWTSFDTDPSCSEFTGRPTFTNCTFTGNSAGAEGGGLYAEGFSFPELENCTFTNNTSNTKGGGVYLHNGTWATLTNCELTGNSAATNGGGLYAGPGARPTLNQSTLFNNNANRGAGLYADPSSHPILDGCTISGNAAATSGGGAYFSGSEPIVTNCLFEGNSSVAAYGGGMWVVAGVVEITGSTFRQNSSPQGGGAYLFSTAVEFEDCTFLENQSTDTGHGGAGIYSTGISTATQLSLRRCSFRENQAAGGGGGVYSFDQSAATLTDCLFIGNTAAGAGGGFIAGLADPASLTNCRFIGNSSNVGGGCSLYQTETTFVNCLFNGNTGINRAGGLLCTFNRTTLINCTLTENSANSGGGVSIENDPDAELVAFTNSIIWGNRDQFGTGLSAQILPDIAIPPTVNHSIVQGWDGSLPGANNLGADPLFADSTGFDKTVGTEDDDLHILPASPATNAGDNAAVPPGVITDLDGNVRISDMIVDMGAFEVAGACPNGACNPGENRCTCPADCGSPLGSEVTCNDGADDDCDDLTDCQDADCDLAANCQPPPVPAASSWGLMIFALLATTAGTIIVRRQAPQFRRTSPA